jgi:hypothetical protein
MVVPIDKWLEEKNKQISELLAQIDIIKDIQKQLPDLSCSIDRCNKFRLHSTEAIAKASDIELSHACGCCEDSALLARPCMIVNNKPVFAIGYFSIGEKAVGGEKSYHGWQDELRNAGIQEELIKKVEQFFEANKPKDGNDEVVEDPEPIV